tara:strand:- start:320 stop:538 length:219 start_codon:yes stop_codon:yes gene_type:complete
MGILKAIKAPIEPPIKRKTNKYKNPDEKFPTEIIVTPIARAIPIIPNKFPCLEVSGDDNPLKAKIKSTPDIK